MSRSHAQIQRDHAREAEAAREEELRRVTAAWQNLRAEWSQFEKERQIAVTTYGAANFTEDSGPFAESNPNGVAGLRRAYSEGSKFLIDRRNQHREQVRTAKTTRQRERMPPVPVLADRQQVASGSKQSLQRNLNRFAKLALRSVEATAEMNSLVAKLDKAEPGDSKQQSDLVDQVRDVVVRADKAEKSRLRLERAAEREAQDRDNYLFRLWDQVSWNTVNEAAELRLELSKLMRGTEPLPDDLDDRVGRAQALQREADRRDDDRELAAAVATALAARDEFIVAPDMVDLLSNGEKAFVAATGFEGHGLQIVLEAGELRATSVVEDDCAVDRSFSSKWCDELSERVYDDLRRSGWSVSTPTTSHQTIQEIAASRLPRPPREPVVQPKPADDKRQLGAER